MTDKTKYNLYYYSALVFALWFMVTSSAWAYYGNLIASYPFGLLSLLLWYAGKRIDVEKKRYKTIIIILLLGLIFSAVSLLAFLITN